MSAPKITIVSPHALLVQWEAVISKGVENEIGSAAKHIASIFCNDILEMVPAYHELALYLKPNNSAIALKPELEKTLLKISNAEVVKDCRVVTIPVCYEGNFALDLQAVAKFHNISTKRVVALHTKPIYRVSFLGFLPGFPYLSGLSKQLHTPRKDTPRQTIIAGSVGIGGKQTGVYPQDSPGGWNIIGKSPLQFFNPIHTPPALLQSGDSVKFVSISPEEYYNIATSVQAKNYTLEIEQYDKGT